MINPVTIMKLLNERKDFVDNHPEFLTFIFDMFGNDVVEGTIIQMKILKPDGIEEQSIINVCKSDMPVFGRLKEVIKQITG